MSMLMTTTTIGGTTGGTTYPTPMPTPATATIPVMMATQSKNVMPRPTIMATVKTAMAMVTMATGIADIPARNLLSNRLLVRCWISQAAPGQ